MARQEEFEVSYVSNGPMKTTQKVTLVAANRDEAKRRVEAGNNKVIAVIFLRTISG